MLSPLIYLFHEINVGDYSGLNDLISTLFLVVIFNKLS